MLHSNTWNHLTVHKWENDVEQDYPNRVALLETCLTVSKNLIIDII